MNERLPFPDPLLPPEQHGACLLVADLVGSTRLARLLPLHQYVALMTELIQLLILHFEAHGAQILQHQGDAVVCMWPLESTGRAVTAGLESHTRAEHLNLAALLGQRLELRVGLAVGDVISGPVGGTISAYGLPVNLARRMCSAALPGETLACPNLPRYAPAARFGEREVSSLAGFEELGLVYRVLGPTVQSRTGTLLPGMKTG
ncbi:adenylate/guanylate cyclase domain-containing protein [Deinococcus radiomollis]|uniref:adenylate/guanylate cyclase domain-containing protein n=1 Tax=Deinococcus radiomollis TaxID=468916 RepID=UPI0038926EA8